MKRLVVATLVLSAFVVFVTVAVETKAKLQPMWQEIYTRKWAYQGTEVVTECNCINARENFGKLSYNHSGCIGISNYTLKSLPAPLSVKEVGYTGSVIQRMIKRPDDFRRIQVADASFAASEGREPISDGSLRSPGGDFAEFVYLLTWYEKNYAYDFKLFQEDVDGLFFKYIQQMRQHSFYFNTDEETINKIKAVLIEQTGFDSNDILDLTCPPPDLTDTLLRLVVKPDYQGNVFLKLLLFYPDRFGISLRAAQMLIRSYHMLLWDKDRVGYGRVNGSDDTIRFEMYTRLKFVVKKGTHQSGSWVDIVDTNSCTEEGIASIMAPTHTYPRQAIVSAANTRIELGLPPKADATPQEFQTYVYNGQAANQRRRQLAEFLARNMPTSDRIYEDIRGITRLASKAVRVFKQFAMRSMSVHQLFPR